MKHNTQTPFTFVDLFSGIGGFRIPLEENGGRCVGFSEIDKIAIETYKKNFKTNNELELGDISQIQYIPQVDIVVGGVPCQSWSVAGKRQGFDDPRGKLWFDTINYVKNSNPKAFIFENVKGLADPRNKINLELIVKSFEGLGYICNYKVLNTFDYGLPQNRERIFIVGVRSDIDINFEFPIKYSKLPLLGDILNTEDVGNNEINNNIKTPLFDQKNTKKLVHNLKNAFNMSFLINQNNFFTFCDTRNGKNNIHSWDLVNCTDIEVDICMAILKNRRKKAYGDKDGNPMSYNDISNILGQVDIGDIESLVNKKILCKKGLKIDFVNSKNSAGINNIYRIYLPSSHVFSTLTKTGTKDYVSQINIPSGIEDTKLYFLNNIFKKNKFRKLSVIEASRLQGFPDNHIYPSNYSKAMGLLGNALGVNIVRELVKQLRPILISSKSKK